MRIPLLAIALVLPLALAGCLNGDDDPTAPAGVQAADDAQGAGEVAGEAPSAPKSAFKVNAADGEAGETQELVAHPMSLHTNPAREPVTLDLSGEFAATDCMGFGLMPGVAQPWRQHDLSEELRAGDVYQYEIQLSYETTPENWAEIHMVYGLGNTAEGHNEAFGDTHGTRVINFTGQGYRVSDDDMAWLNVNCWYGQTTKSMPYTLTVKFTFAEDAVPAQAPILVPIPEGATKLFVKGLALDPTQGVNSHYRLFGPDDQLLCECGLGSLNEASYFEVPGPGDYVLLVDHTANGFVSLALDVPTTEKLRALDAEWVLHEVATADGGAVDQTVDLDLQAVPLLMHAFSVAAVEDGQPVGFGAGKVVRVEVVNGRGTPLAVQWGGFAAPAFQLPIMNAQWWWGLPLGDWDYQADHHAYDSGSHQVHVKADALRGTVVVITRQYVR